MFGGPDEAGSTLEEGDVEGDEVDIDELVERIHEYLTDVKTTQIRLGLHTMSEPPEGERLTEYLVALSLGSRTPVRRAFARASPPALGVDYQTMLDSPGEYAEDLRMT